MRNAIKLTYVRMCNDFDDTLAVQMGEIGIPMLVRYTPMTPHPTLRHDLSVHLSNANAHPPTCVATYCKHPSPLLPYPMFFSREIGKDPRPVCNANPTRQRDYGLCRPYRQRG